MLAFSLTVGDLMKVARHGLDAEADMAETSAMVRVAEAIYVLALALSSALSAFPITFALLEVYYIGYNKTARPSLSRVPHRVVDLALERSAPKSFCFPSVAGCD